jgi:hypothetical protein
MKGDKTAAQIAAEWRARATQHREAAERSYPETSHRYTAALAKATVYDECARQLMNHLHTG